VYKSGFNRKKEKIKGLGFLEVIHPKMNLTAGKKIKRSDPNVRLQEVIHQKAKSETHEWGGDLSLAPP